MHDLRKTAELIDVQVTRRLVGNHLSLLEEERKREEFMDQVFTGKSLVYSG